MEFHMMKDENPIAKTSAFKGNYFLDQKHQKKKTYFGGGYLKSPFVIQDFFVQDLKLIL